MLIFQGSPAAVRLNNSVLRLGIGSALCFTCNGPRQVGETLFGKHVTNYCRIAEQTDEGVAEQVSVVECPIRHEAPHPLAKDTTSRRFSRHWRHGVGVGYRRLSR